MKAISVIWNIVAALAVLMCVCSFLQSKSMDHTAELAVETQGRIMTSVQQQQLIQQIREEDQRRSTQEKIDMLNNVIHGDN